MEEVTQITAEEQKKIEEIVTKLLTLLEVDGSFILEQDGELLNIILETKDTGMVIGYHGEGLEALQTMLGVMITKQLGRFIRISVEVDGYKKNRTEYLEKLAQQAKERALTENKEQVLMSLKAWERRIVHMILQNDDQVITESSGEGRDRVLVIKPKA
jgi:spoIIIJ-associated protein